MKSILGFLLFVIGLFLLINGVIKDYSWLYYSLACGFIGFGLDIIIDDKIKKLENKILEKIEEINNVDDSSEDNFNPYE